MYKYIPLTLTFKQEVQKVTGIKRLLKRIFVLEDKNIKYNFCPEIGSNFKFHFHGYIEYRNDEISTVQRFLSVWKRHEGFYYIGKNIDGKLKNIIIPSNIMWHIYCHKDYWIHQKQINNINSYNMRTQLETYKCHLRKQGILKYLEY